MASKLSTLVPSIELTNIILGAGKPEGAIADLVFPEIVVEKEVGTIRKFGKDYFMQHRTLRAMNAGENWVPSSSSETVPYALQEYSLETTIDFRVLQEKPDQKRRDAEIIAQKVKNGMEKYLADLLQNTATYDSGNSETVSSSGDKWGYYDSGGSDVIGQVADARVVIEGKIGRSPNTLILSNDAWAAIQRHPQFIERVKYSAVGLITVELAKQLFDVENIIIAKQVYTDSPSGVFTPMYSECAILCYIAPGTAASEDTPSFGYTLTKKGFPVAGEFTEGYGKITHVGVTYINSMVVTSNQAAYLFLNVL